jgi:hypothetical protein
MVPSAYRSPNPPGEPAPDGDVSPVVKIFLTALATIGGALWGYVLGGTFSTDDWPWRLIALPPALLVGGMVWAGLQMDMPLFAAPVSMARRIFTTIGMSGTGLMVPVVWTHHWHPALGVLLGVPFALVLGAVAWRDPDVFKGRRRLA